MSERVSHPEIECCIPEAEIVYPPLAGRLVRIVQLDTPVHPDDEEVEIETGSQPRIETEL